MGFMKGNELMIFYNSKEIAGATSHQISFGTDTAEIQTKDHGYFKATEVTGKTWSITTDNLFTFDKDNGFEMLYDLYAAGNPVTVVFGHAGNYSQNGLKDISNNNADPVNWSLDTAKYSFTGKAIITSLNLTAGVGENATFSCEFQGVGALTKTTAVVSGGGSGSGSGNGN